MKDKKNIIVWLVKFFCIAILPFLSSCATPIITKAKCKDTNWYREGMLDGANGRVMQPVDDYVTVCEKYKFFVDVQAYKDAYRNDGLPKYCTYSTGESLGSRGYDYPNICEKSKFPRVNSGWKKGIKNYCVFSKGQSDAASGIPERYLCAGYSEYASGWQQGALRYCTQENGFNLAKQGKVVRITCPSSVAASFNAAYDRGARLKARIDFVKKQIKDLQTDVSNLEAKINNTNKEISKNNDDIRMFPNNPNNDNLIQENFTKRNKIDNYRLNIITKRNSIDSFNYELRNLESKGASTDNIIDY